MALPATVQRRQRHSTTTLEQALREQAEDVSADLGQDVPNDEY